MMADMNEVSEDIEFVQESLDDYMDTIRAAMPEDQMYHHKGELRYTTMESTTLTPCWVRLTPPV